MSDDGRRWRWEPDEATVRDACVQYVLAGGSNDAGRNRVGVDGEAMRGLLVALHEGQVEGARLEPRAQAPVAVHAAGDDLVDAGDMVVVVSDLFEELGLHSGTNGRALCFADEAHRPLVFAPDVPPTHPLHGRLFALRRDQVEHYDVEAVARYEGGW